MRDCGSSSFTIAGFVPGPDGNVWPKRQFTYAFDPDRDCSDTSEVSAAEARAAVRRAFASWEQAGNELAFSEVSIDDDPDLTVQWVPNEHSGPGGDHKTLGPYVDDDGNPQNGIAHAPFPPSLLELEPIPRYLCFDDEEVTWFVAPDTNDDDAPDDVPENFGDIEEVAVHEIGHFLGLDHSTDPDAVMQSGVVTQRSLAADDIAGIRKLYPLQGRPRFNAIWTKPTVPRRSQQQVDEDDMAQLLDDEWEAGWRPRQITSYRVPGAARRYNIVLEETDQERPWSFGRSEEVFAKRAQQLADEGYTPLTVNAGGDGEAWSGVWKRGGSPTRFVQLTTPDADTAGEDAERDLAAVLDDERPTDIDTYVDADGTVHWLFILGQHDIAHEAHLGRTRKGFEGLMDELADREWAPTAIGAYVLPDGRHRWNAVFEENDHAWRTLHSFGEHDLRNAAVNIEADDEHRVFLLNSFLDPPKAATTSLASQVVTQPAPPAPTLVAATEAVAVDGSRVYATRSLRAAASPHQSDRDGTLVVVDRASLALVHEGITVGHQPRHVAVNPVTQRVYVVNWGARSYSLSIVDGITLAVLDEITLGSTPMRVAVNPATNRVYVTNTSGAVHVIDGDTHEQLAPIGVGVGPLGITVDPERNQIYVTVVNLSTPPARNGLYRITDDADHSAPVIEPFVAILPLAAQSQDVAVDADHDRVYVANLGGGHVPPSVTVLHRTDLGVLATVGLRGPGRAIAVDPDTREVYVATDRGVDVIDGSQTHVRTTLLDGHMAWDLAITLGGAPNVFLADRDGDLTRLA